MNMDYEDKMKWPSHEEDYYEEDDDYYYDDEWDEQEYEELSKDADVDARWEDGDKHEDDDIRKQAVVDWTKLAESIWRLNAECNKENTPSYYSMFNHQPIDVMKERFSQVELIGFYKGNLIKYCMRLGEKEDEIETLQKIINYATWLKELKEEMRGENNSDFAYAVKF